MISARVSALGISGFVLLVAVASADDARSKPDLVLSCLPCTLNNGEHIFDEVPDLCDDEEEREQNGCVACGGTSVCHWWYWDEGPCHDECAPQEEAALMEAYETADLATVAALVVENPDLILLNEQRRAVQLKGCKSDAIFGHLPSSGEEFGSLVDAIANFRQQQARTGT